MLWPTKKYKPIKYQLREYQSKNYQSQNYQSNKEVSTKKFKPKTLNQIVSTKKVSTKWNQPKRINQNKFPFINRTRFVLFPFVSNYYSTSSTEHRGNGLYNLYKLPNIYTKPHGSTFEKFNKIVIIQYIEATYIFYIF